MDSRKNAEMARKCRLTKEKWTKFLFDIRGINGVGTDGQVIRVYWDLREKNTDRSQVPTELDGIKTVIIPNVGMVPLKGAE